MEQAVTWGAVFWVLLAIAGAVGVLGAIFFVLSIIGEGFKH
jgi:hypothetical protein